MKNIVRIFALSLVATGAFASANISNSPAATITSAKVSAMPVPMCPPGVPDGCGIFSGK